MKIYSIGKLQNIIEVINNNLTIKVKISRNFSQIDEIKEYCDIKINQNVQLIPIIHQNNFNNK